MPRNPNLDKAKLQAVGVYRKASTHASINKGAAQYSGGDYRAPEGAKACYHGKPPVGDHYLIEAYLARFDATVCPEALNSSGRAVFCNELNRKGGQATPRMRKTMNRYATHKPAIGRGIMSPVPAGIVTLIKA
jgi:hypothetical protein